MTRIPTGPHWPGHSPPRETNESSPGVSPVPSECGLEPNGDDRPNPTVGFLRVYAEEEVKRKAGKISGSLRAQSQAIDREDCIIGATALLNDEPVVTRNRDRFERTGGLDVETY